jgi:hypothetical protein
MAEDAIALARAQSMDVPSAQNRARLVKELAAGALTARHVRDRIDYEIGEFLTGHPNAVRRANSRHKALKRVFFQSAFVALAHPESKTFYDRKRSEGKRHNQADICAMVGVVHVHYLARLTELELINRQRRMIERKIQRCKVPVCQKTAIASTLTTSPR